MATIKYQYTPVFPHKKNQNKTYRFRIRSIRAALVSSFHCSEQVYRVYSSVPVFSGLSIFVLSFWTSAVGMVTCCVVFGICTACLGPTVAECVYVIVGTRLFGLAFGISGVGASIGWFLGAPAAGACHFISIF